MSPVYVAGAVQVLVLSAGMIAQSAPSSCPAGRPVDDIIAEIHKQQGKKKHHVTNPLPDVICIWGWCRDRSRKETPPTVPESEPQTTTAGGNDSTSSSRIQADPCQEAMETALEAAHDVEVGDYYFAKKNDHAALLRYKDAAQEKPGDVAIHVRLGRVFERLGQLSHAIEQYSEAQKYPGPQKWSDEAKAALLRLQHRAGS